jgi:hypothetical protein
MAIGFIEDNSTISLHFFGCKAGPAPVAMSHSDEF